MTRKRLITLLLSGVLIIMGAIMLIGRSESKPPVLGYISEFKFMTQSGMPFELEQMYGKVSIVDFIYISDTSHSAVMSSNMASLYRTFENERRVQFVSITVAPRHDSYRAMYDYLQQLGVTDTRWTFLRAEIEAVMDVLKYDYVLPADSLPEGHSTKFVLLDDIGQVRGYYSGIDDTDQRLLEEDIRKLVDEMAAE